MSIERSRLELYAKVVAEIASGEPEDVAYAQNELTEPSFQALEREVEGAFSAALEAQGDAPSPFLVEYDAVMRAAHARAAARCPPVPFDDFARAIAAVTSGRDPVKALEAVGLTARDLTRGAQEHGAALAKSPELLDKLEKARSGEKKR
jgi:hypothetical protein